MQTDSTNIKSKNIKWFVFSIILRNFDYIVAFLDNRKYCYKSFLPKATASINLLHFNDSLTILLQVILRLPILRFPVGLQSIIAFSRDFPYTISLIRLIICKITCLTSMIFHILEFLTFFSLTFLLIFAKSPFW